MDHDHGGEDRISGLPDELLHAILARLGSPRQRRAHRRALPPLAPPLGAPAGAHPRRIRPRRAASAAAGRVPGRRRRRPRRLRRPDPRAARHLAAAGRRLRPRRRRHPCRAPRPVAALRLRARGRHHPARRAPAAGCRRRWGSGSARPPGVRRGDDVPPQPRRGLAAPAAAGRRVPGALTVLRILSCRIEAGELAALVSTQCPCLMDLMLDIMLVNASDLSIQSYSLGSLSFSVRNTQRLEIVAPRLEKLSVAGTIPEARISAPKLAEVEWPHSFYNPQRHQFDDVGRRLRVLKLGLNASLMQRFDEVDELKLAMFIPQGIAAYQNFLNETNNLPKCKVLTVSSGWFYHGLVPGMLHLLRSCSSTRKVFLRDTSDYAMRQPCVPGCPCLFEESHRIDDISLNSLEEVEITSFTGYHGALEFLEQLSRCNAAILKKIVLKHKTIFALPPTKEVCEKILGMWQPNIEVESYLFLDQDWVRLY